MRTASTERSAERDVSKNLKETTPKSLRRFMQLYDESQDRKVRQDTVYKGALEGECTFKPKLNANVKRATSQYLNKRDPKPVELPFDECTF
jgi:hypothetical protein